MKGFAKIFEAIIASIILLASLTFFFIPTVQKSNWDDVSLRVLTQDALQSIYLNGTLERYVKADNTTELIGFFSNILPKNVDFSISVEGLPNKNIYISCVDCASGQLNEVSQIVAPSDFSYKKQNISIRIESLSLSQQSIPKVTNILFFFDKSLITTYEQKIRSFLAAGGSAFLLSDLTEADTNGVIGEIFNLSWAGTTDLPSGFDSVYDAKKVSHFIARYYANISAKNLPDIESQTFTVFEQNGIKAENDDKNIVKTSNGRAFVRANYNVTSKGRTVWVADYDRLDHLVKETKAIDNLTKASIMWASGERFKLDLMEKKSAPVHFKTIIFSFDEDNYIVELTVWRIFY